MTTTGTHSGTQMETGQGLCRIDHRAIGPQALSLYGVENLADYSGDAMDVQAIARHRAAAFIIIETV